MAEGDNQRLTVELEESGQKFTQNILSYSLDSSWTVPTDGWSFTVFDDDDPGGLRRTFSPWQLITLHINGQKQLMGRIEQIRGVGNGKQLEVSGYDYLHDLQKGGIDPTVKVTAADTLEKALLRIFEPWGITEIVGDYNKTRNLLTGRTPFGGAAREFKTAQLSDFKARENQGAWEFAMQIVARYGFTIQAGVKRSQLVLAEPEYRQEPTFPLKRPGNILTASDSQVYSSAPTLVVARGRAGFAQSSKPSIGGEVGAFTDNAPGGLGKNLKIQQTITAESSLLRVREQRFRPEDNLIFATEYPVYRPMFYRDKDSRTQEQLDRGIKHELAEKLRDTLGYSCSVQGHEDPGTGQIYSVDTIGKVVDTVADIDEPLWVMRRRLYNDGSGPMTEMDLIRPESYVL